ncbi:MAG: hypothetical protein L0Z50_23945 [Verrucomicrobiales bacterium]|nr:hypothetical protein [Verrucomicrobiales bacterium]
MPRKKEFETVPYNPIAADLAREVAAAGRISVAVSAPPVPPPEPLRPLTLVSGHAAESQSRVQSTIPSPRPKTPEPTITKRFILTRSEDKELNAFLVRLQQRSGAKAAVSTLARVAVNLAMQAEEQLLSEVDEAVFRPLPSTHDSLGQGEFEEQWQRCLASALRKLPRSNSTVHHS